MGYPQHWSNSEYDSFKDCILLPSEQLGPFQRLLDNTYHPACTRDRACPARPPCRNSRQVAGGCSCCRPGGEPGLPVSYRVCQVLRIEDSKLWQAYVKRRREIQRLRRGCASHAHLPRPWREDEPATTKDIASEPGLFAPLDTPSAEMYLFHGTNTRSALTIASEDVRLDLSRSGGGLGPGLYLSESVTKSDEYASDTAQQGGVEPDDYYGGVFALLFMRAAMGEAKVTNNFFSEDEKRSVNEEVNQIKLFDSVLCDRRKSMGTFREFCLFDNNQIYTEYVIFYERIYRDPRFGLPRFLALHPNPQRQVLHFQVPSYWVNFHKNPNKESFDEEHELRPRALRLVLRGLQLLSGGVLVGEGLRLIRATRYESSALLREYVSVKVHIQERKGTYGSGVSNPGLALKMVFGGSAERLRDYMATARKSAWSPENIDNDINEIYLWALVPMTVEGRVPNISAAVQLVRQSRLLFSNPVDALRSLPNAGRGQRALFLCRALCGEMAISKNETPGRFLGDSVAFAHAVGFRVWLSGERQIYPEMLLHVET